MHYLFNAEGMRQLAGALSRQPLLAFDFDGTLAPIVPLPDDAKAPLSVAAGMQRLCAVAPVAIITGRGIDDVRDRLGFEPHYIIGNHGAEGLRESDPAALDEVVNAWLIQLQPKIAALPEGVQIERKRYSLTLHYRLARERDRARHVLEALASSLNPRPELIGGKCVLNLMPPGAPNKQAALLSLLRQEGRQSALFVGDDETDEAVFRQAPPDWLTIRVEYSERSAARYYIGHQSEIAMVIQMIDGYWRKGAKE